MSDDQPIHASINAIRILLGTNVDTKDVNLFSFADRRCCDWHIFRPYDTSYFVNREYTWKSIEDRFWGSYQASNFIERGSVNDYPTCPKCLVFIDMALSMRNGA